MNRTTATPYFRELEDRITGLGGFFNAHLHLDRAGTYHGTVELLTRKGERHGEAFTLAGKHAVIPMVHASPMYDSAALEERVAGYLDRMVEVGTRRADTLVDVTADRVGLSGLETFLRLKERYRGRLDFRSGAYSPLGFRNDEPQRWELVREAAESADFIGLLPERDDRDTYPQHIGFDEAGRRGIRLAHSLGKKIHIHVDQANHEYENGAERIVRIVRELGAVGSRDGGPFIWLVHLISPSTYGEERFSALLADLVELNIGVIVCPSAAISMRQYRVFRSPTFNSIARVLELLAAGVQVRLGSDNICDITSPMGTADLMDELFVLANAVRFYDIEILAKLACGKALDEGERARIKDHLAYDAKIVGEAARMNPRR
jgi:cytosine/adenosine deaminase-related metal-dependent hydrolase